MKKGMRILLTLLALTLVLAFTGCAELTEILNELTTPAATAAAAATATPEATSKATPIPTGGLITETPEPEKIREDGVYTSKDDVALYLHLYGKLPSNFITKNEAKAKGWSGNGNDPVGKYAPGKCIGGDYFGNYEGLLPTKKGRKYTECDIDTLNQKKRGEKRIIFSNDGLIYYTEDHYETFTLLYGEE